MLRAVILSRCKPLIILAGLLARGTDYSKPVRNMFSLRALIFSGDHGDKPIKKVLSIMLIGSFCTRQK
jgi:hypothetical protein